MQPIQWRLSVCVRDKLKSGMRGETLVDFRLKSAKQWQKLFCEITF